MCGVRILFAVLTDCVAVCVGFSARGSLCEQVVPQVEATGISGYVCVVVLIATVLTDLALRGHRRRLFSLCLLGALPRSGLAFMIAFIVLLLLAGLAFIGYMYVTSCMNTSFVPFLFADRPRPHACPC